MHTHDAHAHSFAVYAGMLFGNKSKIIVSRRVDFPVKRNFLSVFKYNYKNIARIICVSDKIKEITSPAVRDMHKLITIHSGIDTSRFTGKKNTGILHREFNLKPDLKLIGNVAALAPHKDYFTFVDTVSMMAAHRKDCMFFIIGEGDERSKIEHYISRKGLSESIILTGFRNDIPNILPELDVMLITSETEGLGTAILDAFACNVPVAATAAGGIPEIVIHEKTGLLAPVKNAEILADAVNRLLDDQTLRTKIIAGATQHLLSFTRQVTAAKTLCVYNESICI